MAQPVEQLSAPPRPNLTERVVFENLIAQGRDPMLMTNSLFIISNEAYSSDPNVSVLIPPGEGEEAVEYTITREEAAEIDSVRREILAARSASPIQ